MIKLVEANWLAFVLALLIGLIVAWWLFRRGSRGAPERSHRPDVLDEGVAPAARNQALIDAPPAAGVPTVPTPAAAVGLAGIGQIVSVAAQDAVEEASVAPGGGASGAPMAAGASELGRIKGIGPKLVALLGGLGVTRLAQVAAWDDAAIDRVDAQLGSFAGRIRRDNWVEQARLLADGDTAGFEARFGKL